jgi:hypothetical protein
MLHMDNGLTPRRTGYAFSGKATMPLKEQQKALMDARCVVIFEDIAPGREDRNAMIEHALGPNDTLVICKPSLIGSGEEDTAETVRKIGAIGVPIEVIGNGAHIYTDEAEIADFAKMALKVSRQINARRMVEGRARAGPKAKLDALLPEAWADVRWWWLRGAKQQDVVDFIHDRHGLTTVTRVNIAHRIAAELKKTDKEPKDGK